MSNKSNAEIIEQLQEGMNEEQKEIFSLSLKESAGYRNLIAIRDYVVETRKEFRELQEDFKKSQNQVNQLRSELTQLRQQYGLIQARLNGNRSTT